MVSVAEVVADNVKTAAMRAMLPRDILERFVDGPFIVKSFGIVCPYVGEKLAGQDASGGVQHSETERNDGTRGGKELLAFVDSGAVDNVLPKSVCTEYPLEATPKLQSGVGFEGANESHIKHYGQRRFRVRTSAGSNMNTTREVADVRKPLISASHLLQRGHKLVLDEKPRIQCKNGDIVPLERTGGTVVDSEWFSQARPSTSRVKKKKACNTIH